MKKTIYFVSGIDTDAGKSYATGFLAHKWNNEGVRTITQKLVQTGSPKPTSATEVGYSEDIDLHRRIMGIPYTDEDKEGLTCPEVFSYAASPLLASRICGRPVDLAKITAATDELSNRYDIVLLEGAGGLMVPLKDDMLTVDYIALHQYPVIFVTSGKLGSINHTLLSLEVLRQRKIQLYMLVYNLYPGKNDPQIQTDTYSYFKKYLEKNFPDTLFISVPEIKQAK